MLKVIVFFSCVIFGLCAPPVKNGPVMPHKSLPVKPDFLPKIILGEDAKEGQFPYMISLNYNRTGGHRCGASVLTDQWALTAAHCCITDEVLYIFSGTIYLSGSGQRHEISQLLVNEKYDPDNEWKNDVCLIQIKDKFQYDDNTQQITLPTQGWPVEDGDLLTITGWGYTDAWNQIIPDTLQVGNNFVALSNERCQLLTGEAAFDGYICALGSKEGQAVCNGDSGSPLVKNGVQVGVASWVFTPCGSGYPDFYARVPTYIDWIKEKLGSDAAKLKFVN